jgi:acyl carrier protein
MTHSPTQSQVLDALADFLADTVPAATGLALAPHTRLLGSGILDSLGILQLSMFLGERFGVEVEDEDFTEENFATAGAVAAFVAGKLRTASA